MTHERFKEKINNFLLDVLLGVMVLILLFFALGLPIWAITEANRNRLRETAEYIGKHCD